MCKPFGPQGQPIEPGQEDIGSGNLVVRAFGEGREGGPKPRTEADEFEIEPEQNGSRPNRDRMVRKRKANLGGRAVKPSSSSVSSSLLEKEKQMRAVFYTIKKLLRNLGSGLLPLWNRRRSFFFGNLLHAENKTFTIDSSVGKAPRLLSTFRNE